MHLADPADRANLSSLFAWVSTEREGRVMRGPGVASELPAPAAPVPSCFYKLAGSEGRFLPSAVIWSDIALTRVDVHLTHAPLLIRNFQRIAILPDYLNL